MAGIKTDIGAICCHLVSRAVTVIVRFDIPETGLSVSVKGSRSSGVILLERDRGAHHEAEARKNLARGNNEVSGQI